MTDFLNGPLVGFDTETTGTDPSIDRVVSCSVIYSHSAEAEPVKLNWLINPGIDIPQDASDVHGITTEYVQMYGQEPKIALTDIADKLSMVMQQEIPIVAYNLPFDLTLLYTEFSRYDIDFPKEYGKYLDPLVIDKAVDKYRRGSRKLIDTAKFYGYDLSNAHEAEADVLATIYIARALKSKFQPEMTIEMFQEAQKDWKAEQSASFQEYKRRTDPEAVIDGSWPYMVQLDNEKEITDVH